MCLSCGLCCDGGLFNEVSLDDADRQRLAEHGIEAADRFPHPCRHHAAPACAIYAVRPSRCARYSCRVLSDVMEGELGLDEARDLVGRALTMRARVADVLPEGLSTVALAEDFRTAADASREPARLPALARFIAYRLFVERHFLEASSHWLERTKP